MANRFRAFVRDEDGGIRPIAIYFGDPIDDACDAHVWVIAPVLFARRKRIYGVDAAQAAELSRDFVRRLLS